MTASMTNSGSSDGKPVIMLLSLKKQPFWDEMYAELVSKLNAQATVHYLTDVKGTGEFLQNQIPFAIIATDETLCKKKPNLTKKLIQYVHGGGTLILATHFPSFVRPPDLASWFQDMWKLPWETGNYQRTIFSPNPERVPSRLTDDKLPGPFSMKALFLKNVPPEAMVFKESPNDQESPVIFASVGNGWLGYIGDVNGESASGQVLLAMCGI